MIAPGYADASNAPTKARNTYLYITRQHPCAHLQRVAPSTVSHLLVIGDLRQPDCEAAPAELEGREPPRRSDAGDDDL